MNPYGTFFNGRVGRRARTYLRLFCVNTGCRLEDLPGAMDDRDGCVYVCVCVCEKERERERELGKSMLSG